jgi:ABC-type bacteriocin/lantibiotic exporter with double-glycine peptidase domain
VAFFLLKTRVRLHLGSYVCVLLASALTLLDPLIVRLLIDNVIPNRRINWLPLIATGFFITYLSRLGFESLGSLLNFAQFRR